MPKISRGGGPSYVLAEPGDTAEDALQRRSALHPDEQAAFPLVGEADEDAWLTRDPEAADGVARDDDGEPIRGKQGEVVERKDDEGSEDVSPGDSSSQSNVKPGNSDEKTTDASQKHAPTTVNHSDQGAKPGTSIVDSADTSGRSRRK